MQRTTNLNLKKPDTTDNVNIGDLNYNADILDTEVAARPKYTVTEALETSVTLKNYDTTFFPTAVSTLAVTLPTPSAGNDYLCGVIFEAASGQQFSDTAPTGYAIQWDSDPTWTAGKVYEIIYRCLWMTDGDGNVIISAKWSEL